MADISENILGSIKKLDVRKIWKNEASEFTPWLAGDANIAQLGQAIGLELEVDQVEASVGPYSADILAKDTGTGKYVVIENQLGKTNHDHLGKAITYGSVLDAGTVIWIATEFTEEHQRALDWLNEYTTEELSFFGVLLELHLPQFSGHLKKPNVYGQQEVFQCQRKKEGATAENLKRRP